MQMCFLFPLNSFFLPLPYLLTMPFPNRFMMPGLVLAQVVIFVFIAYLRFHLFFLSYHSNVLLDLFPYRNVSLLSLEPITSII